MKLFSKFLLFVSFIGLMLACEQEDATPVKERLDSRDQIEQYVKQYLEQHGQPPSVAYTSLEALNELFVANGLPTMTLEELGITFEQYEAAQERIKAVATGTAIENRCDDTTYDVLGDIDLDNQLTSNDVVIARMIILGTSTQSSRLFGCLSDYAGFTFNQGCILSTADIVVANGFLLGLRC